MRRIPKYVAAAVTVVLLAGAAYGYVSRGPRSLRAEYRRRRDSAMREVARSAPATKVTEDDLAHLPGVVAGYVRRSGAVGRPRVSAVHAAIRGRIRGGPGKPWMTFTGEQYDTFGTSCRRYFFIDATMFGLPVDVLHVFDSAGATMRGRLCSLIRVLDGRGPDMDRSESVTVFNDLCILAPAALVGAPVDWQEIDEHRVRGTFRGAARPVSAELVFDDDGDLVDFLSDDRLRAARHGGFTRLRWRTPVGRYRVFDGRRVAAWGEARWQAPPPEGDFSYLEFHVDAIGYQGTYVPAADRPGPDRVGAGIGAEGGRP